MMRITNTDSSSQKKRQVHQALVQECQIASPGSKLSEKLRRGLEGFTREDRRAIAEETFEGCAPLFLACKNGSAEIVDYLLSTCDAPLEQRGLYEVLEEGISHHVTPLWCAAVSGRLAAVKILLRHGADVNAMSDSGSTPIRSACYIVRHGLNTSHFDIIKCLVRAGADVQQPNHFGGTCLINSVQSPDLVKFLLESGVNVNAEDVQHKTALHYAVQENRLESAKLLLGHGADPFRLSKYGDDVLQTACLKGALMIFNFLLENVVYEPHRIADAFELMGSTFLLDMHDLGSTLFFWRKSLEIRHEGTYLKYPKQNLITHPVLLASEIDSKEELEQINGDIEELKIQGLLISERILGSGHKDTIFRYMYAGAAHADANDYKPCVRLWNYALFLKVQKETLLSCDTSFTARAVVQLYVNILMRDSLSTINFEDVFMTTQHVNGGISVAMDLLQLRPECKAQLDNFDIVLTTWVHLIFILLRVAESKSNLRSIFRLVQPILDLNPKTQEGDSLLHLAVSSSATLKSNCFLDDDSYPLFPSPEVADFILKCGFDIHARNLIDETPLHIACKMENFSESVSKVLLEHKAHLDTPDKRRIRPQDILQTHSAKINVMPYVSLKCLATQALIKHDLALVALHKHECSQKAVLEQSDDDATSSLDDQESLPPNMPEFIRLHSSPSDVEV